MTENEKLAQKTLHLTEKNTNRHSAMCDSRIYTLQKHIVLHFLQPLRNFKHFNLLSIDLTNIESHLKVLNPEKSNKFENSLHEFSILKVQVKEGYTEGRRSPTPTLPNKHKEICVAAMHLGRVVNFLIRCFLISETV